MASEDDDDDDDILALVSEPSESDELADLSNSFSALLSTPTGSDEKTVGLSPEEAAWVDSCLVLDAELSDDNWIAFTEALLDTLSVQNSNYEPDYVNGTLQGPSVQITERSETDAAMYVEERDEDADAERDEDTSEGNANAESSEEVEQEAESRESIFKVWDLETLISSSEDEDDELIEQQLKKLLIGGSGPEEKIIDEVAAIMADLSLRPLDD